MVRFRISALADDLLDSAEDHIIDILLDELLEHNSYHAPFFSFFTVYSIPPEKTNFNERLS